MENTQRALVHLQKAIDMLSGGTYTSSYEGQIIAQMVAAKRILTGDDLVECQNCHEEFRESDTEQGRCVFCNADRQAATEGGRLQ